jgi:hypothetical protein
MAVRPERYTLSKKDFLNSHSIRNSASLSGGPAQKERDERRNLKISNTIKRTCKEFFRYGPVLLLLSPFSF